MPSRKPDLTMTPEQRALWQRVTDLWAMSARRDDTGIRNALHPDYAGWDMSAAAPHDRDAAVHSASGDSGRLIDHALDPLSVRVYQGTTGVVHYRYAATVAVEGGATRRVTGRWTEVYAKAEGGWLMVAVSGQPDVAVGALPTSRSPRSASLAAPRTAAAEPSGLLLRSARPSDALCLGVLGMQVFLDTYATQGIRPTLAREVLAGFSTEACRAMLAEPRTRVQVAEVEGHLVGFAELALGSTHELAPPGQQVELSRLYVQTPFAGQGIGTALLRVAEQLAAAAGATVLWLDAWVHNRRALGFYARHGYQDCGPTLYRFEDESHENRVLAKRLDAGGPQ